VLIPALRVLRYRNYRLFFAGQTVSLTGTWMTRLATSWLVYRLTHSAVLLGMVGFAGQIPTFLLAPFAGVLVDRWHRRRVLVITQTLLSALTLTLAALTLAGRVTVAEIMIVSVIAGIINAFDIPGRQAFLIDMVEDRANLGAAVALNSSMVNIARLAGPSLAGVTIAAVGEGYCFLIDGLSYLAVIGSLLAMRMGRVAISAHAVHPLTQLKEGWTYVSAFKPARTLLVMYAIVSLAGMPYTVLMPAIAATTLGGGPGTLGLLMAATGLGALLSAIRLAVRSSVVGLYSIITLCAALFGVALVLFALSHNLIVSTALMIVAGYGMMLSFTAITTVIQTIAPEDMRGRVISYWTMAYMGAMPFGSVAAGALAGVVGAPGTLVVCGIGCVIGAVWFWSQRKAVRGLVRPIYQELGILPPE
jgi:MFS family permease